jgi:hypothetical protein
VSAEEAFQQVLAKAGATLPARDPVDARVVANVRNRTGTPISAPKQARGYPLLAAGIPPVDSDHDGMPDAWEIERGLNPQDPADGAADRDGDGYTNVEEYLHSVLR